MPNTSLDTSDAIELAEMCSSSQTGSPPIPHLEAYRPASSDPAHPRQ